MYVRVWSQRKRGGGGGGECVGGKKGEEGPVVQIVVSAQFLVWELDRGGTFFVECWLLDAEQKEGRWNARTRAHGHEKKA